MIHEGKSQLRGFPREFAEYSKGALRCRGFAWEGGAKLAPLHLGEFGELGADSGCRGSGRFTRPGDQQRQGAGGGEHVSGVALDDLTYQAGLAANRAVIIKETNTNPEMRAAAENLVPVTLELGGKSPVIVGRTASGAAALEKATDSIMMGKMTNAGQILKNCR